MVNKNLFLYDLAVVSIMKNEGPYIKEWLDYHLLAGVNHFFLYDNESEDNFKEILQPYIDAEIVTYIFYPGKARQIPAYNEAVKYFKFFCRYMAFIDGDEFIFPHSKSTIIEVVDEILSDKLDDTAAIGINWRIFGSNGNETADYNVGVLDRFTARDSNVNKHIKTIANPRMVNFFPNSHYAMYFAGQSSVNEEGKTFSGPFNEDKTADKISINHYHTKSREEYEKKVAIGKADGLGKRTMTTFDSHDLNEVKDDGILKYRDERMKLLEGSDILETFSKRNEIDFDRILKAVTSNLLPAFEEEDTKKFLDNPTNRFEYFNILVEFLDKAPPEFFKGKIETYLTCLSVSTYLKENFIDEELGNLLEEFSLYSIYNGLMVNSFSVSELQLLIKEFPHIFSFPYPIVEKIRAQCLIFLPHIRDIVGILDVGDWKDFVHLDYLMNLLKVFDDYNHK